MENLDVNRARFARREITQSNSEELQKRTRVKEIFSGLRAWQHAILASKVSAEEGAPVKRILIALMAVPLILVAAARPAWAKEPTAKITISGGGLASEIEVTDPRILDISNMWYGKFLDQSKGAVKEPPMGLRTYEVWLYIKFSDNDVRRRYVVYYSSEPSTGQGYIYLPGKGQPWYWLNTSALLRDGRDGKWSYASAAWQDLIKPVIAGAEAAPARNDTASNLQ